MGETGHALLLTVFMVATSIWVGGYVAIGVVARSATATLDGPARVAFFRSLGRSYLRVGTPALIVALATGTALLWGRGWDALLIATVAVVALLLIGLAVAVAQARAMTRLRGRAVQEPGDEGLAAGVRSGARRATALRAALGLLTIAAVVLGSFLASSGSA
jgi:uncharacterized membrane protein